MKISDTFKLHKEEISEVLFYFCLKINNALCTVLGCSVGQDLYRNNHLLGRVQYFLTVS